MRTTKQLQLWSSVLVCAGILGAAVAAVGLKNRGWVEMAGPAVLALALLAVARIAGPVEGGARVARIARVMAAGVIALSAVVLAMAPGTLAEWLPILGSGAWVSVSTAASPASCCRPRWLTFRREQP